MVNQTYKDYLKSLEWKVKRIELIEECDGLCSICGEKGLQFHHLNYDNLGNEELEIDIIFVCNQCHKELHNKINGDGYGEY